MDDRSQRELMAFATEVAEHFPRHITPVLQLVKGGAV
jgi:hypothetical protein